MTEHNCRNLGGYKNNNPVKVDGRWIIDLLDDYYNFEIQYCPFCGIKLK